MNIKIRFDVGCTGVPHWLGTTTKTFPILSADFLVSPESHSTAPHHGPPVVVKSCRVPLWAFAAANECSRLRKW
jgi:hypothetical protein